MDSLIIIFICMASFRFHYSLGENTTITILERVKLLEKQMDVLITMETTTQDNRQIEPLTDYIVDVEKEANMLKRARSTKTSSNGTVTENTEKTETTDPYNVPITPIVDTGKTKRRRTRKTTLTKKFRAEERESATGLQVTTEILPMETQIMYRRWKDAQWMEKQRMVQKKLDLANCQILFTPLWMNRKIDSLHYTYVTEKDLMLNRLVTILHLNVTNFTYDDKMGVLRQVSMMRLRMFLWRPNAIKIMMNTLIVGNKHNFDTLRIGVQGLFRRWRIDYSNTSVLLKHSQIFRPPCMNYQPPGSTKNLPRPTLRTIGTTTTCKTTISDVGRSGDKEKEDQMEDMFAAIETGILNPRKALPRKRVT